MPSIRERLAGWIAGSGWVTMPKRSMPLVIDEEGEKIYVGQYWERNWLTRKWVEKLLYIQPEEPAVGNWWMTQEEEA